MVTPQFLNNNETAKYVDINKKKLKYGMKQKTLQNCDSALHTEGIKCQPCAGACPLHSICLLNFTYILKQMTRYSAKCTSQHFG